MYFIGLYPMFLSFSLLSS